MQKSVVQLGGGGTYVLASVYRVNGSASKSTLAFKGGPKEVLTSISRYQAGRYVINHNIRTNDYLAVVAQSALPNCSVLIPSNTTDLSLIMSNAAGVNVDDSCILMIYTWKN